MTYDEAFAAAILGDRVRAVDMPEGVYIDYHFNGLRINFPSGSNSGYSAKSHDQTVDWAIVPLPVPAPKGWDMSKVIAVDAPLVTTKRQAARRGRRPSFVPPAVIDDVAYGAAAEPPSDPKPGWDINWGSGTFEPGPVKVEAWPSLAKPVEDTVSSGWAIFDKDKANE